MTATKTTSQTSPRPSAKTTSPLPPRMDAIAMLKADHEAVNQLFAEYEGTHSIVNKKALVAKICTALSVHVQIEEEIFYPAIKAALKDKLLVPEALVEHTGVKGLIAQLEDVEPDGEMYDAKVKVLSEYVKHHVKEEQTDMFPQVKATSVDMAELGARMATRRNELLANPAH